MEDKKNRIITLIDFEREHEGDIIYYRKIYSNCGEDNHDEATYGYFLLSEAKDGDVYQEVTTAYTLWICYNASRDMFFFTEEDDVLSAEEVEKIVTQEEPNISQYAKRCGFSSIHRLSESEFYDVIRQFCNIEAMQSVINDMYRRLN